MVVTDSERYVSPIGWFWMTSSWTGRVVASLIDQRAPMGWWASVGEARVGLRRRCRRARFGSGLTRADGTTWPSAVAGSTTYAMRWISAGIGPNAGRRPGGTWATGWPVLRVI